MPGNPGSAAQVDPPVLASSSVALGVGLAVALAASLMGCATPGTLKAGSCGEQCSTLSCPPGTHCTLTSNCTPFCQQDTLAPR
jgi:hypothetical protein